MKFFFHLSLLTAVFFSTAQASLVLNVNAATETLWLEGSDTGNSLNLSGIFEIATWQLGSTSGTPEFVDLSPTVDETFTGSHQLNIIDGSTTDGIRMIFSNSGPATPFTTITGNSTPISYAGLSSTSKTILESFRGQTMSLDQGSGWDPVDVIPEPETFVLVAFFSMLIFNFHRKKRGN